MSAPLYLVGALSTDQRRREIARLLAISLVRCRSNTKPSGWTQEGVAISRPGSVHVHPFQPRPTR